MPEVISSGTATLRALIREYLFISLFRACAESLASEECQHSGADGAGETRGGLGGGGGVAESARGCVVGVLWCWGCLFADGERWGCRGGVGPSCGLLVESCWGGGGVGGAGVDLITVGAAAGWHLLRGEYGGDVGLFCYDLFAQVSSVASRRTHCRRWHVQRRQARPADRYV